jgi:hypothetical protein
MKRDGPSTDPCGIPESTSTCDEFTPLQHGFRRNRSCETQLIEFIDDLIKNLQEGLQTDVLIMDFAKAFDKVNHTLLRPRKVRLGGSFLRDILAPLCR